MSKLLRIGFVPGNPLPPHSPTPLHQSNPLPLHRTLLHTTPLRRHPLRPRRHAGPLPVRDGPHDQLAARGRNRRRHRPDGGVGRGAGEGDG